MQINLNGMYYILNLKLDGPGMGLIAEIVDEGFHGPVRREPVQTLGDLVRLIRAYSGLKPDAETLRDLSGYLEDQLDRAMETSGDAVPLAIAV